MAKGKGKFSFSDTDKGYKKFKNDFSNVARNKPYVKAGILERAGGHDGTSLSVADIATVHEFGNDDIGVPERSFLRWVQANKGQEIRQFIKGLGDQAITAPRQALNLLGLKLVALIKDRLQTGDFAPLKDPTRGGKNKEGGGRPLIDTGQMRNSVQHEVKDTR